MSRASESVLSVLERDRLWLLRKRKDASRALAASTNQRVIAYQQARLADINRQLVQLTEIEHRIQ